MLKLEKVMETDVQASICQQGNSNAKKKKKKPVFENLDVFT